MVPIGSLVVYGQNGVCRLLEICVSPFDKQDTRPFYVFKPELASDHSTIFVPVEMAEGRLRRLMSEKEAQELLTQMDRIPPVTVTVEKTRKDVYRQTMARALPEGYVGILKAVAHRRAEALRVKRQLASSDAEYEQKARSYLALELSEVLKVPFQEMMLHLTERLGA